MRSWSKRKWVFSVVGVSYCMLIKYRCVCIESFSVYLSINTTDLTITIDYIFQVFSMSDWPVISPYSITPESTAKVTRIKENDHQSRKLLTVEQILLISTRANVKRTVWRIWMPILGCKEIEEQQGKIIKYPFYSSPAKVALYTILTIRLTATNNLESQQIQSSRRDF